MTTHATMTAAVCHRFGGPEVVSIEQRPIPRIGPRDVLIRVRASTVSIADHRARARDVPAGLGLVAATSLGFLRPKHPVLGMDAAGVVAEVGSEVSNFAVGDHVATMLNGSFGGHGEFVRVPASGAITRVPTDMPFEDAVALVFGGITALGFLSQVTISSGTTVLVNGASGAVGTAVVQLATHLGAAVTAVTSAPNAALATSLGARRVVDYAREDFTRDGARYDVVVDCVGNAGFDRVAGSIAPGGALLLVICDLKAMLRRRAQSRRSGTTVSWDVGRPGAAELAQLFRLADAGHVRPVIDRTYDLAEIVDAHRYVDTGRKRGSVVVRIGSA